MAAPPEAEVDELNANLLTPEERVLPESRRWTFPAASVSAVELTLKNSAKA